MAEPNTKKRDIKLSPELEKQWNSLSDIQRETLLYHYLDIGMPDWKFTRYLYDKPALEELVIDYKYHNVTLFKWLDDEFETPVSNFLRSKFDKLIEELEYADNFRCAEIGNQEQERMYKKVLAKGCCGYHDEVVEFRGKKYKIGLNYGH